MTYWQFVRLDSGGKLQSQEIAAAKAFYQQQFSEQPNLSAKEIQNHLFQLLHSQVEETRQLAECCLRCFISVQIQQTCLSLYHRFGQRHGFLLEQMLPYVLTDSQPIALRSPTSYRSLATEILQTYDPHAEASLGTWSDRLVKHDKDLNQFLLEHGVLLVSDWAILNDTKPEQVRRILSEVYPRSPTEIQQICYLLEGYHTIYLRDRRAQPQVGKRCSDPTPEQQQQIAQWLQTQGISLAPASVLTQLRSLAQLLRQHRIQVRTKLFHTDRSLDEHREDDSQRFDPPNPEESSEEIKQNEFLTQYYQQLLTSLDQAIAQIIQKRLNALSPPKDQQWLTALDLMHCQGMKMAAIASQIGLRAQDAVTRLLKLKALRADIRHCLLGILSHRIQALAQEYAEPTRLQELDQRLNAALEEQVDRVMQAAEAETNVAHRQFKSLFAHRLCLHLDKRKTTP